MRWGDFKGAAKTKTAVCGDKCLIPSSAVMSHNASNMGRDTASHIHVLHQRLTCTILQAVIGSRGEVAFHFFTCF